MADNKKNSAPNLDTGALDKRLDSKIDNSSVNKSTGNGLAAKLSSLFKAKPQTKIKSDDFRKEKKVLTSYRDVVKSEKARRQKPTDENGEKTVDKSEESEKKPKGKIEFKTVKQRIVKNLVPGITDKWRAPQMLRTNLIKGEVTMIVDWDRNFRVLLPVIIMTLMVIGTLYGALMFWEKRVRIVEEQLAGDIKILTDKIINTSEDITVVDDFQKKLQQATELLDNHIYWTNFFEFLENNLLSDAYVAGGFSGNTEGKYNLPIRLSSYEAIADQVRILEANEYVKNVKIAGGSLHVDKTEDGEGFTSVDVTLEIQLDPKIFLK
ncbi:hypothetical protein KAJ89_06210 [Candidatus Parcubacteria bacterium]|nr:hypothetical protein [Candidatus Parcubacteria bacterium]